METIGFRLSSSVFGRSTFEDLSGKRIRLRSLQDTRAVLELVVEKSILIIVQHDGFMHFNVQHVLVVVMTVVSLAHLEGHPTYAHEQIVGQIFIVPISVLLMLRLLLLLELIGET